MQALRRILGIRWYDKVSNAVVDERTKLPDLPSLIADRRHSLFGHLCRLPENTPASQALQLSIEAHTGTPPAAAGSSTKNLAATSGRRHWPVCWLVLSRSQAKIVRCGGRYDPQLVKRCSGEWLSCIPCMSFRSKNYFYEHPEKPRLHVARWGSNEEVSTMTFTFICHDPQDRTDGSTIRGLLLLLLLLLLMLRTTTRMTVEMDAWLTCITDAHINYCKLK